MTRSRRYSAPQSEDCDHKRPHYSKPSADRVAQKLRRRFSSKHQSYHCKRHRCWHVGEDTRL